MCLYHSTSETEAGSADLCEFQPSLDHTVSSRTGRATKWDPASNEQTNKQNKMQKGNENKLKKSTGDGCGDSQEQHENPHGDRTATWKEFKETSCLCHHKIVGKASRRDLLKWVWRRMCNKNKQQPLNTCFRDTLSCYNTCLNHSVPFNSGLVYPKAFHLADVSHRHLRSMSKADFRVFGSLEDTCSSPPTPRS